MARHWFDYWMPRFGHPPPEPSIQHPTPNTQHPTLTATLLYWRVYETTDARVALSLPPYGAVDGYPTRREAVIAAYRMSRAASREGRPERYCVGCQVEEVADPLGGRCLR